MAQVVYALRIELDLVETLPISKSTICTYITNGRGTVNLHRACGMKSSFGSQAESLMLKRHRDRSQHAAAAGSAAGGMRRAQSVSCMTQLQAKTAAAAERDAGGQLTSRCLKIIGVELYMELSPHFMNPCSRGNSPR